MSEEAVKGHVPTNRLLPALGTFVPAANLYGLSVLLCLAAYQAGLGKTEEPCRLCALPSLFPCCTHPYPADYLDPTSRIHWG